jgi:ribonuclease BN (tRNA processing enzyme)
MRLTRREALLLAAGTALAPRMLSTAAVAANPRTKVQLLGTLASTDVRRASGAGQRTGSALLIAVDGALYLIDAGFGALLRLLQAGYEIKNLRHIAVTRHTVDHNADLGTALMLAWSSGRNASGPNDARRLGCSGPVGTKLYLRNLRRQQALTIHDQATALGQTPPFGTFAVPHDIAGAGVVYRDDLVTINAHPAYAPGPPAVAYRIKTPDRDVVFTGSAGRRIDLGPFADGADTIIHEVIDAEATRRAAAALGLSRRAVHRLGVERSAPAAAADLAARSRAGRLVLAGVLPGSTSDDRWKALAGSAFSGTLTVGHDLATI